MVRAAPGGKERRASAPPGPRSAPVRGRRRAAALGAALLCLALALSWGAVRLARRPAALRRDPGLSVLLVTVDTLRADALGCYGGRAAVSPVIDRLAARGVRFTAHAHNVVTLPSHANILTGRLPTQHGIRDNSGFRLAEDVPTLATILKGRGYRTAAFVSAFPLDSRFGLARGFDVYDDRLGDAQNLRSFRMEERPGPATVAAARSWLEAQAGAPTFLWVHLYEPHFPYQPPEAFARRFPDAPYSGEVAAVDEALRPLLEGLLQAGDSGRTLVVLTADHGEATHGIFAYEGTLRVPLILYQPAILGPRVVGSPVRHVDLLPTVLDALGAEVPSGLAGASLLPAANGGAPPPPDSYFEALSGLLNRGWAPLTGVLRGGHKYVDLPLPELYDLEGDPREESNLASAQPERLEALRALLGRLREGDPGPRRGEESAETRERLRALGYVSAAAPAACGPHTAADDPKRLIGLDRQLEEVLARYTAGDLRGALALCEELVRARPEMPLSLMHLGFLRRQAGDLEGAVEALRQVIARAPEDADAAALLGVYLNEAGAPREAVRFLEPYASRPQPDLDVLNAYGVALASLGRPQAALAA